MWIKAKYTFIKTVYSPRFYGGPYLQAKHADVCSGVLFWTACTRRPHVLSLPSRCEKSDSWRQSGWVKSAKKSRTVPQCGHVTLNCLQMASKQVKVEFSSHIFQLQYIPRNMHTVFCFAVLCCGYTLTCFPISIRLTSLALWQSNDCPSASKATLMNMDKYFMWIHYERLHNHNKAKHNKTVCIFLGIYCNSSSRCRCHAGTDILRLRGHTLQISQVVRTVRHWISWCAPTIGNVMRECKIGKSSPHQSCENTCHSNVLESSLLLWIARALACF